MTIQTPRLRLEPLRPDHAEVMFEVLREPALYEHLDYGPPPNLAHVQNVYRRLALGMSPSGDERWFNWIVMHPEHGAMGFVQATLPMAQPVAWIAYMLATRHQRQGFAYEATDAAMRVLSNNHRITLWLAMTEQANLASQALLRRAGFASPADAVLSEAAQTCLAALGDAVTPEPTECLWLRSALKSSEA